MDRICASALQPRGEIEILDGAIEHQHGGLEAVAILDEVRRGILGQLRQLARCDQILRAAVGHGEAQGRVAARERRGQQFLGIAAVLAGFPDGIAFQQLHGFDAGLAALAPLHHALQAFEGVKIHGVGAALAHHQGVFDLAAQRQFDGGQPPGDRQRRSGQASGNCRRREASTIALAFSKL